MRVAFDERADGQYGSTVKAACGRPILGRLSVMSGQRSPERIPEGFLSGDGPVTADSRRVYCTRLLPREVIWATGSMNWRARQKECSRARRESFAVTVDSFSASAELCRKTCSAIFGQRLQAESRKKNALRVRPDSGEKQSTLGSCRGIPLNCEKLPL